VVNALSALQGGGQTYLANLFRYLPADLDARIRVIAPAGWSVPVADRRVVIVPIETSAVRNPYARAVWERIHLKPLLGSLGASVLFCPGGIIGTGTPRNCRTALVFQNMIPFNSEQSRKYGVSPMRLRNWILKQEFRRSARQADLVVCLTDYSRAVIESAIGRAAKSSVTIAHGVPPEFRAGGAHGQSAPAWLPRDGYFLYISTLDHYKAQIEVVKAFALLRKRRNTPQKLVLVGPEYREYGERVRDTIKALLLQNEVVLKPAIPYSDMPALCQGALINLFASECENCPNILIEALAAARPILCSQVQPMPEIAGDAAEYFDPRSPEDLAAKWAALLADPARMDSLARRAELRSRMFDWPDAARRTWFALAALVQR
jgi:glycosyltransferase involved in cell wall biosynthesis